MAITQTPICYFPTTVVLVDDNKGYLNGLLLELDKTHATYKQFYDPKDALAYLEKTARKPAFLTKCVKQEVDPRRGEREIKISIWPIRDEVYNPKRFELPSVLVIDQEMPGLKGLEICEMLRDTPIKKVLLTGEVNDKDAIEAFNNGIIDQFISKNATDFKVVLNGIIAEQQYAFFNLITADVRNALMYVRDGYMASYLLDPFYNKKLKEFVSTNKVCEYYMADDNGSCLLFDPDGKPTLLLLKDGDEMEADYYIAADDDYPPVENVLEGLKTKNTIVNFFTKNNEVVPPKDWENRGMIYTAKKLNGAIQTYYYAYIDDPDANDVERDRVTSFKSFKVSQS